MPPVTQDRIEETGMSTQELSQQLAQPVTTKTSVGQETPNQTAARARQMLEPTVTADQLAEGASPVTVPEPMESPAPETPAAVRSVANQTQQFTQAQSEEAYRLRELRQEQASLAGEGSLQDLFTDQQEEFGVPSNLRQLQDIQLQLADMDTASNLQKVEIASGGQGAIQGQRSLTQQDREAAVRSAGLAARAAVLQGNIETGSRLASQAVDMAYRDRQMRNQNMINQINSLQGVVDNQTGQLLEQEKRQYEEDQAQIARVQNAVDAAMDSGSASSQEIATLTNPRTSDEQRLQVAQSIVARGATEMRDLEVQDARSAIAARNAGVAQGWASIDLQERKFNYERQQNELAAELEALEQAGQISEEDVAQQKKVEQALQLKDLVEQVRGHAGFNLSVGSPGSRVISLTEGGLAGQLYNYLSGQGEGFDALYDQLTESLTLENLDKMSGVLTDKDIEILRSSATRLRKTTTEEEFLNTLNEMEQTFDRTISENGVTPQQARFYYGVDDETISEVDAIWGDTTPTTANTTIGTSFDF